MLLLLAGLTISLGTVFRGCVPFVLAGVIAFALLIIFRDIFIFTTKDVIKAKLGMNRTWSRALGYQSNFNNGKP